jgi:hypothetical protein
MPSKIEALRQLGRRMFNVHDLDEFDKQLVAPYSDRGACLMMATQLETALEMAIERTIGPWDDETILLLIEQDGPLATFSRKIALASALGIIGPKFQRNCTLVRHIRNAFAHAKKPILFSTTEVDEACRELSLINPLALRETAESISVHETAREQFIDVVVSMVLSFQAYYRQLPQRQMRAEAWLP